MLAAIFCWLLVTGASAQWSGGHEYQPFLKEGKTWLVQYDERLVQNRAVPNDSCRYYLQGDTIINDQVYMKAYCQFMGSEPTYYAALREEGYTVYMIHHLDYDGNPQTIDEYTLYSFDAPRFGSFITFFGSIYPGITACRVQSIGDMIIREKIFSYQYIYNEQIITPKITYSYIVECIGSMSGPFVGDGSLSTLLSCYEGDECLYEKGDEIKELEGIHNSQLKTQDSDAPVYDLQGRRVENPKQGEIYIQNGKKYINK